MRNAKTGALLAFFAEVERREFEQQTAAAAAPAPWEIARRPIQIDLAALAQSRRKTSA